MDILSYEFIEGPDDSINGMLRRLVKDLRYNRSMVTAEEFKRALPDLRNIEQKLQLLDSQIGNSLKEYINEIMQALDKEFDDGINLKEDLRRATIAVITSLLDKQSGFNDLAFSIRKVEHYNCLIFSGYVDQRPIDSNLLLIREVFRSISYKYDYIFIDLAH